MMVATPEHGRWEVRRSPWRSPPWFVLDRRTGRAVVTGLRTMQEARKVVEDLADAAAEQRMLYGLRMLPPEPETSPTDHTRLQRPDSPKG